MKTYKFFAFYSILDLPTYPQISNNDQKLICQSEYSIATLFCVAIKHNYETEKLKGFLELVPVDKNAIFEITNVYEQYRDDLIVEICKQTNRAMPQKVTEVDWKLSCDVRTSVRDSVTGELSYKINFGNFDAAKGIRNDLTEFTCNSEELQSLINKLKDIERHCDKLNTFI